MSILSFFLITILTAAAMLLGLAQPPTEEGGSTAFFVFGDSLADNGNNNYLVTSARADLPPYGIDTPTHVPSGRFSNGLNIPDIICEEMGLESPLPYLSPLLDGPKLLVGANFASAGAGILNDTGFQFANIIKMYQQIELFQRYKQRLETLIGTTKMQRVVNSGMFFIVLGGNDFVNNYFLFPFSARRLQYSLDQFSTYLVSEYQKILLKLYDLGARTVMVIGTGSLGCIPALLAQGSKNGQCAAAPQKAAEIFNQKLGQMVQGLNKGLGSDVFIAVNAMDMHKDFIDNPRSFGFAETKTACCGQGPYNGIGICNPTSNLCPNRDLYAFWDPFHPTEKASRFIVQQIMTGSIKYVHPRNLSTIIAAMDLTN